MDLLCDAATSAATCAATAAAVVAADTVATPAAAVSTTVMEQLHVGLKFSLSISFIKIINCHREVPTTDFDL